MALFWLSDEAWEAIASRPLESNELDHCKMCLGPVLIFAALDA
jgi:hypothetical protein